MYYDINITYTGNIATPSNEMCKTFGKVVLILPLTAVLIAVLYFDYEMRELAIMNRNIFPINSMQSASGLSVINSYNGTNLTMSFNIAAYALLAQQAGLEVRTSALVAI